ncbi:MAG: autotransporter outer membrane beta-barrel domain-containing protein [Bacteroidota bacterium]|nr:autotransporter outer membrane beta-barrel domain-containing protein [Bacteroidota bacterium]MDP4248387.1 autotransporter outer membrane beta-barrel domain-containing protein [Bacteroidota bacterium]MDP4254240.1 autotransporter outer membrane beta-barrel domain-containing protein [Bacteroidota bacterium]MDP4260069.1 autotransporter outer membrane beta-barrel domain-containing protein [Bacteroidota bacterium]
MSKSTLTAVILLVTILQAHAQIGVMKLVGKNTSNYSMGFGGFVKTGFPVSDGSDLTFELGADIFFLNDGYGTADGTIMCPLKAGYRYTLDGSGEGFYVEPQAGFNLVGITSLHDVNGQQVNLHYHGVVFAAGGGYLFNWWNAPFDLNLRYETVIDHGGSNNFISLGISRFIRFGKRSAGY